MSQRKGMAGMWAKLAAAVILVFVVLVVLVILQRGAAPTKTELVACEAQGGECVPKGTCSYQKGGFLCEDDAQECCINPLKL